VNTALNWGFKSVPTVKHPCINVCNGWNRDDGICTGCHRSIEQVRDWAKYTETQKRDVLKKIGGLNE